MSLACTGLEIFYILLNVAWWLIIIQIILSWLVAFNVINTRNELVANIWLTLDRMTAPIYRPIRRILPDFGAIDLAPMVVLILMMILQGPVMAYLLNAAQCGV